MKPHEPSRTALMIARQRAAHQVLGHGSTLDDPFTMKIPGEDEKDVLQLASRPGSAEPFRDSRTDVLAVMSSALSTNGARFIGFRSRAHPHR